MPCNFKKYLNMHAAQYLKRFFESQSGSFSRKTYSKGDILLHQGEIEKKIYIIQSGAVRAVYRNENEEFTIRFGYKNSVITSLSSFLRKEPSSFSIEVIRKSDIILLSGSSFQKAAESNPEFKNFYQLILEELITQQMEREIDLLTSSPLQRYRRVLLRSPALFNEIPAKYIASYLRMSPETLSRLRKIDLNQVSE